MVLLCRSGVRSIAAAKRANELGLNAYNILEGFEGDRDASGRRNTSGGWRAAGATACVAQARWSPRRQRRRRWGWQRQFSRQRRER
jgi:hypothetical protein